MKRTLLYTLGLLVLGASVAAAQSPPPTPTTPASGTQVGPNFVDADGDGICDNYQVRQANGRKGGKRYGPGNGSGNNGVGPRDGSGYGARAGAGTCTGSCTGAATGTGQGRMYRGGRK